LRSDAEDRVGDFSSGSGRLSADGCLSTWRSAEPRDTARESEGSQPLNCGGRTRARVTLADGNRLWAPDAGRTNRRQAQMQRYPRSRERSAPSANAGDRAEDVRNEQMLPKITIQDGIRALRKHPERFAKTSVYPYPRTACVPPDYRWAGSIPREILVLFVEAIRPETKLRKSYRRSLSVIQAVVLCA
jgi:hypothetical protein